MTSLFDAENSLLIKLICDELEEIAIELEKESNWHYSKRLVAITEELKLRCIEGYADAAL